MTIFLHYLIFMRKASSGENVDTAVVVSAHINFISLESYPLSEIFHWHYLDIQN
jgi:hypothetical protein